MGASCRCPDDQRLFHAPLDFSAYTTAGTIQISIITSAGGPSHQRQCGSLRPRTQHSTRAPSTRTQHAHSTCTLNMHTQHTHSTRAPNTRRAPSTTHLQVVQAISGASTAMFDPSGRALTQSAAEEAGHTAQAVPRGKQYRCGGWVCVGGQAVHVC